jgi:hypothetical protein
MRELTAQSSAGAAELAASAEQMSRMALSLMNAIDRFKLEAMPAMTQSLPTKESMRTLAARNHV